MSYTPQHGDIYLLDDRKQAGFSLSGTNYSLNPNVWMMANMAITKGWLVATVAGSNNLVTLADKDSIVSILGIALNTVTSGGPYTKTVTTVQNSDTLTGVTTTNLEVGMLVTGASVPTNTFIVSINSGASTVQLSRTYTATGGSESLVFGKAVEIMTAGVYQYTSKVFNLSDVGQTIYPSPEAAGVFTTPGTIGTNPQMTISRSYAATSGNPLMEIGLIISESSALVDLNGDARGATGLTQVTALAGESISNNGTPLVISLGTDGKVYLADRRKSNNGTTEQRNLPTGFLVGANAGYTSGGTITTNTACVIQKIGTIGGFTGLTAGKAIYVDTSGAYTQNLAALSYYTDVTTPVGWASTATTAFITVGFNTQTSDSNPVGSLIAQSGANPDSGWMTCLTNASGTLAVTGNSGVQIGQLNAVGNTVITAPTTNPDIDGTYDFSSLYNIIGTTYGGYKVWVITGSGSANGGVVRVNGVSYTMTAVETTASLVAAKIASLMASTQTGYVCTNPSTVYVAITNTSAYAPTVIDFSGLTNYTGSVPSTVTGGNTGTTFSLPNLFSSTPKYQIKYNNLYQANPPQAPLFRYDTGWTTWGQIPTGCSSANISSYLDIPLTAFGSNPPPTDLFAELYVNKGTVTRKIEPTPVIYTETTMSTTYYRYGYQLKSDSGDPTKARIEFAGDGLAYYNTSTDAYVPIDNTWTYRILIYKTERYNKYYDYTIDQKQAQLWSLGLVDYTVSTSTQGAGYFDRSSSEPVHTTRLNYDGELHTQKLVTTDLTVTGAFSSTSGGAVGSTTTSAVTMAVTAPAGQTTNIFDVNRSGVAFPYLTVTKLGHVGLSISTSNILSANDATTGALEIRTTASSVFKFNTAGDTFSFVRDGESKISAGAAGVSSLSLQINGTTALNINNEGDILLASNPGTAIASSSEKVLELRSADNVTGSSLHLYSNNATTLQAILTNNADGVYLDSAAATTKSIDLRIAGTSGLYITSSKNVVLGSNSAITTPPVANSKVLELRSGDNVAGSVLYLNTLNGTSASTMLSSQTTGFVIDSLSSAKSIDLKINGSSGLLVDASRYVNASTRLGVGCTPANIFQVNTGATTTNAAVFSSTGTVRSVSIFPLNADNANNDLVDANDSSIIYSSVLVVGPSTAAGTKRGLRLASTGSMEVWGTTTFNSAAAAANQQVEIASGYMKINAAGTSTSSSKMVLASNAGADKGHIGGYFSNSTTLAHYYMGTSPTINTEFTVSSPDGNGTFYGTCTATTFFGNLGSSATHSPNVYATNAHIDTETTGIATITEANITSLRGSKIGWNPNAGGLVEPIAEAYITSLGMNGNYVTAGYINNLSVNTLSLTAGTTSVTPMKFTTGVLNTTPISGAMEYVTGYFYMSTDVARYSVPLATATNKLRFVTSADTTATLPSGTYTLASNALATSSSNGLLAALPSEDQTEKYFRGDGSWQDLSSATGINTGSLILNFTFGALEATTTFTGNQAGDSSWIVNIPASVSGTLPFAADTVAIRTSTGGLNATYFNATSKRSAKENIIPFTQSALDIIDSTLITSFNFIGDEEKAYRIGFIADDTHEYLSTKTHDQLDINNTLGLLLKAVQELREENRELKFRLDSLTGK